MIWFSSASRWDQPYPSLSEDCLKDWIQTRCSRFPSYYYLIMPEIPYNLGVEKATGSSFALETWKKVFVYEIFPCLLMCRPMFTVTSR